MTVIENCFIYNGKKLRPDCESGNVQPKVKRDRWRRSIRITERGRKFLLVLASAFVIVSRRRRRLVQPGAPLAGSRHDGCIHLVTRLRDKRVVSTPKANLFLSCLLWTLFAAVLSAATVVLLVLLSPFPLRPSCLILWKTNARSCDEVRNALLYRLEDWMQAFSECGNCSRYQVVSAEAQSLWLWHRSEWQNAAYEADISLFFSPRPNKTCHVLAQCLSRGCVWPLDGGASFCTLSRLATESSFLGPLATQLTDDPVCTQFSSAVCPTVDVPQEPSEDMRLLEQALEEEDWLRSQAPAPAAPTQLDLHTNSQ